MKSNHDYTFINLLSCSSFSTNMCVRQVIDFVRRETGYCIVKASGSSANKIILYFSVIKLCQFSSPLMLIHCVKNCKICTLLILTVY